MPGPFDDLIAEQSGAAAAPASTGGPFDDLIEEHSGEGVAGRLKTDLDFEPTPEQAKTGYESRFALPDLSGAIPAAKSFFLDQIPSLAKKAVTQIPGSIADSYQQFGVLGGPNAMLASTAAEAALQGSYQLGQMVTPPLRAGLDELAAEMQDPKRAFLRAALQAVPGMPPLPPSVLQKVIPRSPEQEAAAVGSWVDRTKAAGDEQRAMSPYLEGDQSFTPGANPAAGALAGNFVDPTLLLPAAKAAGLLTAPLRAGAKAGIQGALEQVAKNAADKGGVARAATAAVAPIVEGAAAKVGSAAETVGKAVDTLQPVLDVAGLVKGGLPGAAGAHVIGRAASAGFKWAKKVGEAATGLRNVAAADWNSAFPVYAQLAKDADAPVWLKRAASSAVAPAIEATMRAGGAVAEGVTHGAALGAAAGVSNDTMTPEEKGGAIGVGGAFGGLGAAFGRAASKGARVEAAQAHDIAVRMQRTIETGTDPAAVLGASDSTMYYADNLEKLFKGAMPGGKDLSVRLLDANQFAQANPGEPGAVAFYRQTPEGGFEAAINLAEGGGDARLLHEAIGHALIDSVVGSNPDMIARVKATYSPELLQQASEQYAKALKADATPEEVAAYVQQRREESQAAHGDPDAWIAAEVFAEAAVQKFAGMDLLKMATPGFLGRLSRRLRTAGVLPKVAEGAERVEAGARSGQKFDVSKGTFFSGEVASKLSDPNLAEDITQRVRDLGSYRPGVDATIEPSVRVKPTDWGKAPHAPLHDLPGGAKGNDYVVQKPGGQVVERTPKQVRTIVRNRVKEIDRAVPQDVAPAPVTDQDPLVKLRKTVSGLTERTGTKLGDWFYKGAIFSETTKAFAKMVEKAIETGEALAGWYHQIGDSSPDWKGSVAREFGNLSAQYKDFVPIGFKIPKKGNLLVQNYSLTAFDRKAAQWSGRKGPTSLELWNGDVGQFRDDVKTYLKNHSENRPGADGIGEAKRNVINAFMVGANRTFEALNPLRTSLKGEDKQGLVRSYRMDRLETVEPSQVTGFNQPKYEKQVKNLSPKVADDRTSGLAFKNFFSDVTKGAEKYRPQTPWKSLLPLDEQEAFVREYSKHTGNFDNHIATSIPGYKDVQVRKGAAIVQALPEGGRMLDIGASEGSFVKTVSALSGEKVETVALDPNPDMAKFFREKSTVPSSSYVEEAFLNGFEDGGKEVPAYAPEKPFDVIHEAMVFQFISKDRAAQVAEAKRFLTPDGVFLTEEKVLTPPEVWKANELKKDKEFKNTYYSDEKLAAKQAVVKFQQDPNESKAVGMVDNMVSDREFEGILRKNFKHVVQYWDSGNFKGYAASDSPEKLSKLVDGMGDLNTKFSTEQTPRSVSSDSAKFSPRVGVPEIKSARDEYLKQVGRRYTSRQGQTLTFKEDVAKRIADFHDAAEPGRLDPETRASYHAWNKETEKQFHLLQKQGFVMEPWEGRGEPYKTSADMIDDLRKNKHMFYLKSESAIGDGSPSAEVEYPPLELSSVELGTPPRPVPYNDLFRAVHDVFGHGSEGHSFTKDGEYRAWDEHSQLYSEAAQSALALETLVYNAWFNAGKHLRRSDGGLPQKGDADFVPLSQRKYAPRKTYMLPPELLAEATPGREAAPAAQFSPSAEAKDPYVMETTKRGRYIVKDSRTGEILGPKAGYKESYEARSAMLLKNQAARAMASEETAALSRKGAAKTSKTPPTGWILPNGEYMGAEDATGAFQNTGDWHLGQLTKNAEDFKTRFGLTAKGEDARAEAVTKGFVRVRLDGASGRLGIEALAPLKPATKQKILDIVESNSSRISKVDLNLFNRAGKVVGGGSESIFKEDAPGKRAAVEAMFSPRATAQVPAPEYTTSVAGVARSDPLKPEEKGSPIRYANLSLPKRSTSGTKVVLDDPEARPRFFDKLTKEQEKVAKDPARLGEPKGYAEYMRNAGVYGDIMTAPPGLRQLLQDPKGYVAAVEGGYHEEHTKPGTKEAATAGLDSTVEMRKLIRGPEDSVKAGPPPLVTALHHFWGILSRQLPPVQQEAAWLRLSSRPEALAQIQKSIDGTYDLTSEQWSALVSAGMKETAQGDNKMGNQGTSNANAFHLMLARWSGVWDKVSDVYAAPNAIEMGRRFWSLDRGPIGIKNKVQRFIGLTYGIPGLIIDRWKFVELYMGQYGVKPRDYFNYSETGTPSDPNSIYGAYGPIENRDPTLSLAFYEGMETALQKAIDESSDLKTMLGKHANVGGLHWMGWNAIKNEAVGHSSLGLTYDLLKASTNPTPEDALRLFEANDYYTEGLDGNTLKRFSLKNSKK